MDRSRKGRQHQVDDHVDERGQRSTRVQARVGVAPDVADQGRNGARREHVAGVERALPPRPAHRQVAGRPAPPAQARVDETWKRFTDETTCADEIPEAMWTWTEMWVPPWPLEAAVAVAVKCEARWRSYGGR